MTAPAALVDAEQRVAAARAERDELLAFARRVAGSTAYQGPAGVRLSQLRREAERLVLLVAGDGPS